MNRRGNGEGNIRKRKDGRWEARYYVDTGSALERRQIYGKTRDAVVHSLRKAIQSREAGLPEAVGRATVSSYLTQWLEEANPDLRSQTGTAYERSVRLHIVPHIGRRHLRQLTPADIQSLYATLRAKGLSPTTVRHVHEVLNKALRQA